MSKVFIKSLFAFIYLFLFPSEKVLVEKVKISESMQRKKHYKPK